MCFNPRPYRQSFPQEATLNVNINPNPNANTTPSTNPQSNPGENENPTTLNAEPVEVRTFRRQSAVVREVRLIHRLQQQANERNSTLNCGNRNELGFSRTPYNTRPFILYLQNGEEFSIRIVDPIGSSTSNSIIPSNPGPGRSSIFRVEEVNGNTAILRALKPVLGQYVATCSCCSVDLNDFVGIQTLNDTFVSNLFC